MTWFNLFETGHYNFCDWGLRLMLNIPSIYSLGRVALPDTRFAAGKTSGPGKGQSSRDSVAARREIVRQVYRPTLTAQQVADEVAKRLRGVVITLHMIYGDISALREQGQLKPPTTEDKSARQRVRTRPKIPLQEQRRLVGQVKANWPEGGDIHTVATKEGIRLGLLVELNKHYDLKLWGIEDERPE